MLGGLGGTAVPVAGRFSPKFQVLEARAHDLALLTEFAANYGCEGGLRQRVLHVHVLILQEWSFQGL